MIRCHTPEEIVNAAQEFTNSQYGQNEYDIIRKNCQHFASFCCTGIEHSPDASHFMNGLVAFANEQQRQMMMMPLPH